MLRHLRYMLVVWTLVAARLAAAEVRAELKLVDATGMRIVLKAGGRELSPPLAADLAVVDEHDRPLADGLKSDRLKPGTSLRLTTDEVDGRRVVRIIALVGAAAPAPPPGNSPPAARAPTAALLPPVDTQHLTPLVDLVGEARYQGKAGGLYPQGSNLRPAAHTQAGLELAKQIIPRDSGGAPSPDGKIVLLGIGFSNTLQCMNGFIDVAGKAEGLNPRLVIVNGAQGGRSAFMIKNPDDGSIGQAYWKTWVPEHLQARNVTAAQVQAIWLKETDANLNPTLAKQLGVDEYENPLRMGFPRGAQTLQAELTRIVQAMPRMFPNLKLVYVSSRSYGGWAVREGNREPWSYETGFAVKWLIEQQLAGDAELNFNPARDAVRAPWLSWGPYWWANGEQPRRDGFRHNPADFRDDDRMHHSAQGMQKLGNELLKFFSTDATTRGWFLAQP